MLNINDNMQNDYMQNDYSRHTNPKFIPETTVSNGLKALRWNMGLSQLALAERIQVTRQTISAIEKGTIIPSVRTALKLALFFEIPVEDIFSLPENSPEK